MRPARRWPHGGGETTEPVIERADVDAILGALFDISRHLEAIRLVLEEDDDGEEEEEEETPS
jgi:hypothetical protein